MRNDRNIVYKIVAIPLLMALMTAAFLADGYLAVATAGDPAPVVRAPNAAAGSGSEEIPDWIARWELARVLSYVKRYEESAEEYRKLLKEKSDLTEARAEMAQVLFWQGKTEEALAELERIPPAKIKTEPGNSWLTFIDPINATRNPNPCTGRFWNTLPITTRFA
jgi:tetratricopeptide (TPR) repeat protein